MDKKSVRTECERITKIAEKYESCYEEIFKEKSQQVVRFSYGLGGELMHRGYFCPSLVEDIVVGNVRRGRQVKKKPDDGKAYYTYGFDKDDQLIIVSGDYQKEFIIRENDIEIGIIFSEDFGIKEITECRFSNKKLITYGHYLYHFDEKCVDDFKKEFYSYEADKMRVDRFQCTNHKYILIDHYQYIFTVENGFLSTYTSTECKTDDDIEKMVSREMLEQAEELRKKFETQEVRVYPVNKKRKI